MGDLFLLKGISNASLFVILVSFGYFSNHTTISGENPLPAARVEEVIFTLQELALLVVHPDTVSQLPLHPYLKQCLTKENQARRSHLLVLFPSFCELVISR